MKQRTKGKLLRAVLLLTLLGIAFVSGDVLDKNRCVEAKTCDEAFADYMNANDTYEIARISYFYGQPTSCDQECQGRSDYDQCVSDCEIRRQTALANAEIGLFSAAGATCTPVTVDQCAQARSTADGCATQYPYLDYSDLDERLAVYSQYSACWTASKVDSCQ